MTDYGDSLFKGTAGYYSRYRPVYPASLVRFLVQRFSLDGTGSLLDLGCGTGQFAIRFSDWVDGIVGIDPEPEMINEAARLSREGRINNAEWFNGTLEDYENDGGPFRLVTIAKAFHWMDRRTVLDQLHPQVTPGGGIAIIDTYPVGQARPKWKSKLEEVIARWYGPERRAGNTTYSRPETNHEDIIRQSPFELETATLPPHEHVWTIDSILGHLYSTSYGARHFLGDRIPDFEDDLRNTLLTTEPSGVFWEKTGTSVKLALKTEKNR
ncbi:class I SAM-dependent methyltransferase [Alteribacter natronophilus]|uniref:class I SAM-dependent methyltransferase n=1 Tax=Alteribacter natronophilus TaxID=2583810 RepID=UPI001486D477|nr:class I SAM-dependent methyltransferase [Alteribacter natronophilus]